jgi:hypothetical protein
VQFNGSKGRIEYKVVETSYVNAAGDKADEGAQIGKSIVVLPMFGEPYAVTAEEGIGGHGGGDSVMLNDIFGNPQPDRFKRAAGVEQGAMSILTGIAANKSIAGGMPVRVADLIRL